MRILIVGAGALGGYFGARLLQAGRDVTFLVRPRRAAQLAKTGLVVRSTLGDAHIASPPLVLADDLRGPFDLILVGLQGLRPRADAWNRLRAAVGPETAILPRPQRHAAPRLARRRGSVAQRVLGGLAVISATLDDDGIVLHLNELAPAHVR